METLLQIRDLRTYFFTLSGIVRAVDGISFDLAPGETLGLVGESGCGKSVTALSIMRILPEPAGRIAGGSILFRGKELTALPEREMEKIRGEKIAMVYQEPMTALNPAFTIGDQLGEVFRFHQGLSKREALEKGIDLLQQVGSPSPALLAGADTNPPIDYVLRHASLALLGDSAMAFRWPSALAFVGGLFAIHAFVRRRTGFVTAAAAFSLPELVLANKTSGRSLPGGRFVSHVDGRSGSCQSP